MKSIKLAFWYKNVGNVMVSKSLVLDLPISLSLKGHLWELQGVCVWNVIVLVWTYCLFKSYISVFINHAYLKSLELLASGLKRKKFPKHGLTEKLKYNLKTTPFLNLMNENWCDWVLKLCITRWKAAQFEIKDMIMTFLYICFHFEISIFLLSLRSVITQW